MQVINLFGGPGTGKSTLQADLFSQLKKEHVNVEMLSERAKEMYFTQSLDFASSDPLYIPALTHHLMHGYKTSGEVDVLITDSPLLLALAYQRGDDVPKSYPRFIIDLFNSFDNRNFFLDRCLPYKSEGRTQNEEGAKLIDEKIRTVLDASSCPYTFISRDEDPLFRIIRDLSL